MKKILIPTDFSETSYNAFGYAVEWAKIFKAELILLHTFDLPIIDSQAMPVNYATIYETIELTNFEHFKNEMPKFKSIMKERNAEHIAINHILMDGDLTYNIEKVVKQEDIDFVIMGTKGATSWFDSFLGTNTSAVISEVSVPVLSIPVDSKFNKIETIAFTTRFRDKDIEAMYKVLSFAKKIHAKIKCLYVKTSNSDVTNDAIKRWESIFNEEENLKFFIISNENVKQTIEDFLISQNIDLLTMLTYKRNFFAELFITTTTQKLSQHLKTPILVLHE